MCVPQSKRSKSLEPNFWNSLGKYFFHGSGDEGNEILSMLKMMMFNEKSKEKKIVHLKFRFLT
jgi:hypothetical protein